MLVLTLIKLAVGAAVGVIIGILSNRSTTRVFVVVCMGTVLLTIISTEFFKLVSYPWFGDPGRLSAQAISAIGFIGTGLIWITNKNQVEGLNVAASLWLTAILGMLIGVGPQTAGVIALFVVIFFYILLELVIKWRERRTSHR